MVVLPVYLFLYAWLYCIYMVSLLHFSPVWMNALFILPPLVELLMWNSLRQRYTFLHRIGEAVLIPVLAYVVYSLFVPVPFYRKFDFSTNFTFALVSVIIWLISFILHRCFFFCEKHDECENDARRDFGRLASLAIDSYLGIVKVLLILSWSGFLFTGMFRVKPSPFSLIFVASLTTIFLLLIHHVRHIRDRFQYDEEGIVYHPVAAAHNRITAFVIVFVSLLFSFLVANGRTIISLADIWVGLLSIFNKTAPELPEELKMPAERPFPDFRPSLPEDDAGPFGKVLHFVPTLIVIIISAVLLYIVLEFIFFLRFRRLQRRDFNWRDVLKKGFLQLLKALAEFVADFTRFLLRSRKKGDYSDKAVPGIKINPPVRSGAKSAEKAKETENVFYLYVRLVRWGIKSRIPWRSRMPLEYNKELRKAFPDFADTLDFIVQVYEESMFSEHLLGEGVFQKYRGAVRRITRRRMKGRSLLDEGV